MRELKFRAWKEENGKMHRWVYPPIPRASDFVEISRDMDIRNFIKGADIIEQYTGLKDKNGKEIYEGDIVAYSYFGEGRILKVVFYEGCFCLCETHLEIPHAGFVYYFRQGSRFRPQDDYEVIGNIHENQDLLGDTNVTNKEKE